MRRFIASIGALLLLAACASPSSAQIAATPASPAAAPTPPNCGAPEFAQMDFWVGDWDATWQGGQGVNVITKVLDNCVIQEAFDGGPTTGNLIGHSVSTYDRSISQWRQTWVDNRGGHFALVGGRVGDDFVLTRSRLGDSEPYQRMVFEDIQPDSFTWRWQRSADRGVTWSDSWVISYRRRAPTN